MNSGRYSFACIAVALSITTGCHRSKPIVVAANTATAPDVVPNAVPAVPPIVTDIPSKTPPSKTPSADQTKVADAKPVHPQRRFRRKPSPSIPAQSAVPSQTPLPAPTVVAENRAIIGNLISSEPAGTSKASTEQLLAEAKRNLDSVRRDLTDEEKNMRQQVIAFSDDAQKALNANDYVSAHNLAVKAQLLSAALVRGR